MSRLNETIDDTTLIDRTTGVILVLSRFVNLEDDTYGLQGAASTRQFFQFLGQPVEGAITAGHLSDLLVSAFDRGFAEHLGYPDATLAWVSPEGGFVRQHST